MNKVDFWRGPARPSLPVDMRVPFSELNNVKAYLKSHGLAYSVMIKDIQVRPWVTVRISLPILFFGWLIPWRRERNTTTTMAQTKHQPQAKGRHLAYGCICGHVMKEIKLYISGLWRVAQFGRVFD